MTVTDTTETTETVENETAVEKSGRSKPWTDAMLAALADGQWHSYEEIVKIGVALVDDARAAHEMRNRSRSEDAEPESGEAVERRLAAGRRTVAGQALMGARRFGKIEFDGGKKNVRSTAQGSVSLGRMAADIEELQARLQRTEAAFDMLAAALGVKLSLTLPDGTERATLSSGEILSEIGVVPVDASPDSDENRDYHTVRAQLPDGTPLLVEARR